MRPRIIRAILTVACTSGIYAWAQAPDLTQMKAKLDQLEQMMQDLKQQIASAEAAQQTPAKPLVATTPQ